MKLSNLAKLKTINVSIKNYLIAEYNGILYKSKLYRWIVGGTWFKYGIFKHDKLIVFWSRIPNMDKHEFAVVKLIKTEIYK